MPSQRTKEAKERKTTNLFAFYLFGNPDLERRIGTRKGLAVECGNGKGKGFLAKLRAYVFVRARALCMGKGILFTCKLPYPTEMTLCWNVFRGYRYYRVGKM